MAIDLSPRFTLSLRGYDKDEVDEYLESLTMRSSDADEQVQELQEQTRYLEADNRRLATRVEDLENAIRGESPHTVSALGERITLILNEAEAGAADTLSQAKARADYLVSEAQRETETLRRQASSYAAQASETLAGAQRQAEELAERLEDEARNRAASLVTDAEGRARRRQEQIEGWAQEVISRTQTEQSRVIEEMAALRRRHEDDIQGLLGERDEVVAGLRNLQTCLAQAIEGAAERSRPASSLPAAPAVPAGATGTVAVADTPATDSTVVTAAVVANTNGVFRRAEGSASN